MRTLAKALSLVGLTLVVGCNGQVSASPPSASGDVDVRGDDIAPPPPPPHRDDQSKRVDEPPPPPPLPALLGADECASIVTVDAADHIARIDLATGTVTTGPKLLRAGSSIFTETTAIGVKGPDLWFCTGVAGGKVARAPLTTGIVEQFDVPCLLVTADDSGIYVTHGGSYAVQRYVNEAALSSKTPTDSKNADPTGAIGMSAQGVVAQAYPEPGVRMASGELLSLAGHDGSIWGLSEASGNRMIVGSGKSSGLLQSFDATTGAALGVVAKYANAGPSSGFWGLACSR